MNQSVHFLSNSAARPRAKLWLRGVVAYGTVLSVSYIPSFNPEQGYTHCTQYPCTRQRNWPKTKLNGGYMMDSFCN